MQPKRPSKLSRPLRRQLNSYALAASAAGVSVLAMAHPAEARIVYTPTHHIIGVNSHYRLDLNRDGITDFTFSNIVRCRTFCTYYSVLQKPAGDNGAVGYIFDGRLLLESALKRGIQIGPRADFFKRDIGFLIEIKYDPQHTQIYGPWANTTARYLGLKFDIKGETHYGWARFNVTVHRTAITATLTGYAYETIPNKPIIAGATHGPDVVVKHATLGELAAGRK